MTKIKIGKFKKKSVYDADIEMDGDTQNYLASIGREVITEEQYINIGFNHALIRGLEIAQSQQFARFGVIAVLCQQGAQVYRCGGILLGFESARCTIQEHLRIVAALLVP